MGFNSGFKVLIGHWTCTTDLRVVYNWLSFKWQCWHLNFSTWVLKTVLFIQKKDTTMKWHYIKNKTFYTSSLKNAISLLSAYIKWISRVVFLCAFTYVIADHLKIKQLNDCELFKDDFNLLKPTGYVMHQQV